MLKSSFCTGRLLYPQVCGFEGVKVGNSLGNSQAMQASRDKAAVLCSSDGAGLRGIVWTSGKGALSAHFWV